MKTISKAKNSSFHATKITFFLLSLLILLCVGFCIWLLYFSQPHSPMPSSSQSTEKQITSDTSFTIAEGETVVLDGLRLTAVKVSNKFSTQGIQATFLAEEGGESLQFPLSNLYEPYGEVAQSFRTHTIMLEITPRILPENTVQMSIYKIEKPLNAHDAEESALKAIGHVRSDFGTVHATLSNGVWFVELNPNAPDSSVHVSDGLWYKVQIDASTGFIKNMVHSAGA